MTRYTREQWANYLLEVGKKELNKLDKKKPRKKPEPSPTRGMDKPSEGYTICHSTMKKKEENEKD